MTKKFTVVAPVSASQAAAQTMPATGSMGIDDIVSDERSGHVEAAISTVVAPEPPVERVLTGGPADAAVSGSTMAAPPPAVALAPAPREPVEQRAQMSSPIAVDLKEFIQTVRHQSKVADRFFLETAIRRFIAGRTTEEVGEELRALGGRLRENRR
jgi:hypothetical protein